MWTLGPVGHVGNCANVLIIPLVKGQGNEEVPAVASMEVPLRMMKMRGPVNPSCGAAKQVAVESLLALASPPLAGRSRDLVLSLGIAAKQSAAPAMLLVAKPLI